jgi:ankyrin repeat protein
MKELSRKEMNTQAPDLFRIVGRGTVEEVERATKGTFDINSHNEMGFTALMWASQRNPDPAVLSLLLKSGANINAVSGHGLTALGGWQPDQIPTLP